MSAYVLLQYALHRLEERARLVPTRSAVGRAVQEPLGSIFRPSARLSHAPDTAASAASTEESVTLAADLRKHIAKSSLFSEDLSSHQTRLRKRKPASLSNLHFAAAESSNESPFENRWSPVSPAVAIHEAQMVSPCAVVPARAHLSPRSPRFSASLARSARSPLFIAVEDGFRHLMSGGNLKSPATPKRSKTPRSPGIKLMRGDLAGVALQSPLSPKSPRKFAGFIVPNTKKGTKAVLQSPRKVKFETQSPRKMTFDDEGFTDDIRS